MVVSRTSWRGLDLLTPLIILFLVGVGVAMIYSAYEVSRPTDGADALLDNTVFRQSLFAAVGLVAYIVVAAIDYHVILRLYRWIYVGVLALLMLTQVLGQARFGAQAWFEVFVFTVQPSELCKVLMVVVMARLLDSTEHDLESPLPFLLSAVLVAAPAVLIYLQPDFGIALMLMATWAGMAFLAGVRWRHILFLGVLGLIAVPVAWFQAPPYMRGRIVDFLYPENDPSGSTYNTMQALISIGSGGWWGKGFLQGTQSQLQFLRVRHTDFIFSVLAEEFGFIGSVLVILLYVALILRLIHVANQAPDMPGRLLVGGVATMVFAQAFVNTAMNASLVPVTGLTLPLISYGGSSLTTMFIALGLAQSVALRSGRTEGLG
jgi:rod shape determining protein RodA